MMKQMILEFGQLLLGALCTIALVALFALLPAAASAYSYPAMLRSCMLGSGGILMLLAGIGILGRRRDSKSRFPAWNRRFPHFSISAALLICSIALLLVGGLTDYATFTAM